MSTAFAQAGVRVVFFVCMRTRFTTRAQSAFTLIELLVVIAIVGLLAGMVSSAAMRARAEARRAQCMNNLRQMVAAATIYELDHGVYPPAYEKDFATGETRTWESFLWSMGTKYRIHQCPSFHGEAMWEDDPYTGYNYNASYIGGRVLKMDGAELPASTRSASMAHIDKPADCALFGDGEYESGANKFMRSPWPGALDADASMALGGTQGFRHRGRTNIGFADGHVESRSERYTDTAAFGEPAQGCGFLSPDNSLYDLE